VNKTWRCLLKICIHTERNLLLNAAGPINCVQIALSRDELEILRMKQKKKEEEKQHQEEEEVDNSV
jgi:hypothetical protein